MTPAEFCVELRKAQDQKERELAQLQGQLNQFTADLQICCPHERVHEKPYEHSEFGGKEVRVCECCGLAEEGFSFYMLPANVVATCTRDQVYAMCRGLVHTKSYYTKETQAQAIREFFKVTE